MPTRFEPSFDIDFYWLDGGIRVEHQMRHQHYYPYYIRRHLLQDMLLYIHPAYQTYSPMHVSRKML